MARTLILDIDGVIIRDRLLLEHVRYNIVQYVRAKLPDAKNPARVNDILYNSYGHTGKGLKTSFLVDSSDFNEKVYNTSVLSHLSAILTTPEFKNDAKIIRDILDNNWQVSFLSNSPLVWSTPVKEAISKDIKIIYNEEYLKPQIDAYLQFPTDGEYIFVDDKITNLNPALFLKNWMPVHFNEEYKRSKFLTIGSMYELGLMTNSIGVDGVKSFLF
jgi:hypothetical protein